MKTVTAEDIVRGVVEECGWQLLSFRRAPEYVSATVCHPYYNVPVLWGYGAVMGETLTLGDDVLDALQAFLVGNEEWWT